MPYVGLRQSDSDQIILDRGIFAEVFNELTKLLNFSYTTIVPPDGEWGALKDDGTWSGMVGQLHNKRVDFGMLLVDSLMIDEPIFIEVTFYYSGRSIHNN